MAPKSPPKNTELRFKWACPQCGALPNQHGKGECESRGLGGDTCGGFICECMRDTPDHGETLTDQCTEAYCYHCHWGGVFPQKPKGLQAWEKKAIDAGWTPPEKRRKELAK